MKKYRFWRAGSVSDRSGLAIARRTPVAYAPGSPSDNAPMFRRPDHQRVRLLVKHVINRVRRPFVVLQFALRAIPCPPRFARWFAETSIQDAAAIGFEVGQHLAWVGIILHL